MATMAAAAPVFKQPQPVNPNSLPFFSRISEDLLVNVFSRLEQDPRDLARLACVCRRFTNVIKISCWRHQCLRVVPTIVSELMHTPVTAKPHELLGEPPCGWGSLQKLLVCCPGLRLAGVLLDSWDFGLERELGDSFHYEVSDHASDAAHVDRDACIASEKSVSSESPVHKKQVQEQEPEPESGLERQPERGRGRGQEQGRDQEQEKVEAPVVRKMKEHISRAEGGEGPVKHMKQGGSHYYNKMMEDERIVSSYRRSGGQGGDGPTLRTSLEFMHTPRVSKTFDISAMVDDSSDPGCNHKDPHLAKGSWSLTREQGNKLLASRFRDDSLYICDWPGCTHPGEKRNYKLYRGIFKNFKQSHVWRNLKDQGSKRTELPCAFCSSRNTYDMVTSFCLRRSFEYHDDGEPVVRAYVCENGHVAGAWTDRPLYNL